jgi:hypothetical protein
MIELLEINDPVRLSFVQSLLADAGVECFILGAESPWPGTFPSRLMVRPDDEAAARKVLQEAGELAA